MNVWETNKRSWRKARKRAVSPIIATILLVAITVVLAAVLYVLISGLTHGPGNTPIGSALGFGAAISSTCTAGQATAHLCVSGNFIYTIPVGTSTVTFASILLEVKTGTGATFSNVGIGGFAVETIAGTAAAYSTVAAAAGLAMTTTWATYTGTYASSNSLTSLYSIVVDTGAATSQVGNGLTLVALGTGSYGDSTSPISLP
ncbi:MAG TPA: archaellin/type IV pilin N-terminal domain-containing protein [Thermoplasmata archaeon]|nr:archaellin/type IV pilin N-terminal domain-containing protein [Thermoplasmata archaeon]